MELAIESVSKFKKGHKPVKKSKKAPSKRAKKATGRSHLLKTIMPLFSGDNGESLSAALDKGDVEKIQKVMKKITASLVAEATNQKK